jgi:hypothetical protein
MRPFTRRTATLAAITLTSALTVSLPAAPALAATVSPPPATVPPTQTDWTMSLSLDQFEPSLGELTSATFTLDSSVDSTLQVENLSTSSGCTATLGWAATIGADTPTGVLSDNLNQFETEALTVFDGTIDFGGASGMTWTTTTTGVTRTLTVTDPADLATYTGTGTFLVEMEASAVTSVTGCSNIAQNISTAAGAVVTVVYDYIPSEPGIDIEKATNGEDADTPTGPQIPVGDPVTWTYLVTNTGNVDLTDVTVTDDQGVTVTCPHDTLAVGDTMTCTANGTAQVGQYANLGTATATAPDGAAVADDDPSHYYGKVPTGDEPGIDIEKATNGEDADTPTGPQIPVGDPVTWTYLVTNTGNVDLTDVTVTDDQGVTVTCPHDTLAVGDTMTCTANGTAQVGQYANLGTATATAPDGAAVADDDPSHYYGKVPTGDEPGIDIEKATNGEDADTPTGPQIPVGDPVTWTYLVTNTGNVPLTGVTVGDNHRVDISCPHDTLAVGESMTCTASGTARLGQYANLGTATATAPDGAAVADDDPSHYYGYLVRVRLDCSHGDIGCLGVIGQVPGQVAVVIDGVELECDTRFDPATNTTRFECMVDSRLLSDNVTVEVYVDGVLLWSGTSISAHCDVAPATPASRPAGEHAVLREPSAATTDRRYRSDARVEDA